MNTLSLKFLAILLIFLGEAFVISAEMIAAKHIKGNVLFFAIPLIITGGLLLLFGYVLGYNSFKNIWIISAISITSILFIEPTLAVLIFGEIPTKGAIIGIILGLIGFIFAIFY